MSIGIYVIATQKGRGLYDHILTLNASYTLICCPVYVSLKLRVLIPATQYVSDNAMADNITNVSSIGHMVHSLFSN
jgi:hypothetical protein